MQAIRQPADTVTLGAGLIALAGLGMVGYAVVFVVVNFTHLIEIGLSPAHVAYLARPGQ